MSFPRSDDDDALEFFHSEMDYAMAVESRKYFKFREHLVTDIQKEIFRAGFERAWSILWWANKNGGLVEINDRDGVAHPLKTR